MSVFIMSNSSLKILSCDISLLTVAVPNWKMVFVTSRAESQFGKVHRLAEFTKSGCGHSLELCGGRGKNRN